MGLFNKKKECICACCKKKSVFCGDGLVEVTNMAAMTPEDPLGYMCWCRISVSENGLVEIVSDNTKELQEGFPVTDVGRIQNQTSHYDVNANTPVCMIVNDKELQIYFQSDDVKIEFLHVFASFTKK